VPAEQILPCGKWCGDSINWQSVYNLGVPAATRQQQRETCESTFVWERDAAGECTGAAVQRCGIDLASGKCRLLESSPAVVC
jgi:hypothetical protein